MSAITQTPWGATVGYKCYICYSAYENGVNNQSADYRQKVMDSCAENFFSEITGDEFDWSMIICNEVLPFCQTCWQSIEKIYELNQQKEMNDMIIDEIVKNLSIKVLANRKYLKKKGVLTSTSAAQPSIGNGIKIEGFSVNRNIRCKMCHNVYTAGDPHAMISLDISGKVMEICEQHLYPELIDEGFYDWNSIPFNNYVPFCIECSQDMKRLVDVAEKHKEIDTFISDHVDAFTLAVLKCRRALRKMGKGFPNKAGFWDDRSVADSVESMSSQDSQETIFADDDDDDCRIIGVSNPTDMYPSRFAETNIQDPARPFAHLAPMPSNDYGEDFQVDDRHESSPSLSQSPGNQSYQFENEEADPRPNSAETCVVVSDKFVYSIRNACTNEERIVPEENSSEAESSGNQLRRNENVALGNSLNLCRPSVTIARLPSNSSGTIFKCDNQNCGKIFIFRKCWEAHRAECRPSWDTPPILSCCDLSFSDEASWRDHLQSHSQQSQTRSRSKSLPHQLREAPTPKKKSPAKEDPVEVFRCEYCGKCCGTKKGLKLHTYTHTQINAYKCRKCGRGFGYSSQLKAHFRKEHSEIEEERSPPLLSPSVPLSSSSKSKSKSKQKGKSFSYNQSPVKIKFKISFSCNFCKRPMKNKRELIDHVQTHYSIAEGRRCEICKMVFSHKQSFRNHNKIVHRYTN